MIKKMLKTIKNVKQIFRMGTVLSQKPVSDHHLLFKQTNLQQQNSLRTHYITNPEREDVFFKFMNIVNAELQKIDNFKNKKRVLDGIVKESNKSLKEARQKMENLEKAVEESTKIIRQNIKQFKKRFYEVVSDYQKVKEGRMLETGESENLRHAKKVAYYFEDIAHDVDDLKSFESSLIMETIKREIEELEEGDADSQGFHKKMGGYFRYHEPFPPQKYETHLPDINEDYLKLIGNTFSINNLSPGTFISSSYPIKGYISRSENRLMIPLNCQYFNSSVNDNIVETDLPILKVWFVINTAFSSTFLSETTLEALKGSGYSWIKIEDPKIKTWCYKSRGHFKEANVLGLNFFEENKISISNMDWFHRTFQLVKNK